MSALSGLGGRVAKGAAWMVLMKLAERSIGLVSTLILARILVPADFGLVAMATAFAAVLDVLTSFSFDLALIQRHDVERRHYDTAWTLNLLASAIIAAILFLGAPLAAQFFREEALVAILRFLALCFLVQGFQNIGIVAFQKELAFHREFKLGIVKKLVGMVVALALALWWGNYWALLFGMLATRVTGVTLSYLMHPYRPRWSLEALGDLLHFSKWMLASNILIFANNRGMDLIVGRLSNATGLGLYSVAYEVSNLPTTELVFPISRAVYPGYASVKGDRVRLREAYLNVLSLTALVAIPIGVGIAVFADLAVRLLLGAKWLEAIPLVQVLAFSGVVRAVHGGTGAMFLALDRPHLVGLVNAVIAGIGIPLSIAGLLHVGLIAVPFAILCSGVVAATVTFVLIRRLLDLDWRELAKAFAGGVLGTLGMVAVVLSLRYVLTGQAFASSGVGTELVLAAVAGLVYFVLVLGGWHLAGQPAGPTKHLVTLVRGWTGRPA